MEIIAVANQKGGVGKSTTSINLAAGLAKFHNQKVLIIDLDPQGHSTKGLGINVEDCHTISDFLLGDLGGSVIQKTAIENLDILPSDISLSLTEMKLATMVAREFKLRSKITPFAHEYDFIIIDCPPTFGILTINAFTTAKQILMPVQLSYFSMEGVNGFVEAVRFVNSEISPVIHHRIDIAHVLITFHDKRPKLSKHIFSSIKEIFEQKLFNTTIPVNIRLNEAQANGRCIFDHYEDCTGYQAYKDLSQELFKRYYPCPT